jgi:O-antigen ligase
VALWQKLNDFTFPDVLDGEVTIRLGVPGTFEDSLVLSMFSGTMILLVIMGWVRFNHTGFRILCVLSGLINLLSLKLALSRNGIFLLGVAFLIFLLIRFTSWAKDRQSAMKIPLTILGIPLCLGLGLKLLPQDIYYRIVSAFYLFSGSNDPVILYNIRSTLGRLENYREAVKVFLENPFEGIGLGLYPVLTRFEDADGFYTGLLAETGLIGAVAFLCFAFCVILLVLNSLRRFGNLSQKGGDYDHRRRIFYELFCGMVGAYFLTSFFEPVFKVQIMSFLFFFLLKMMRLESQDLHPGCKEST